MKTMKPSKPQKLAFLQPIQKENQAVSVTVPFSLVAAQADLFVPLRRPVKCRPSTEVERDYLDLLHAKEALAENAERLSYEKMRKDLGLD